MALLSNINDKFSVDSTGAIQFNGSHGTAGQVLKSNGNAAPTWVDASTVIGGPYLPLTGGTLTGAIATASGISFTVGGALTGTTATFIGTAVSGAALVTIENNSGSTATSYGLLVKGGGNSSNGRTFEVRDDSGNTDLIVKGNGNVGIGTNNPSGDLHVVGKAGTAGRLYISDVDVGSSGTDSVLAMKLDTHAYYYNRDSGDLYLGTNNVAGQLTIKPSGNVGIGVNDPAARLEVKHDSNATNGIIVENSTTGTGARSNVRLISDAAQLDIYATSSTYSGVSSWADAGVISTSSNASGGLIFNAQATGHIFQTGTAERMRINSSGNVGIGTTTPATDLHVNSENAEGSLTISRGGNNMVSGQGVGSIVFPADYNGTPTNYGKIVTYANALSALRGSIDLKVKSTSGSLLTGLTVYGTSSGVNVGIGTTNPNATLHVNGGVHFGTDSAVLNPTNGQVLIETVAGGTPRLQMYVYGSSVFDIHSDGTTANIGWGSGADREVNFQNTGTGGIKVGIATGAPSQPLDVSGYSICDKQLQRDNTLQTIVYTPRVLNIGYRGANGTYTFNPVSLFGSLAQGGQCVLQVTGWRSALNNGIINWSDNGNNTNIGAGQVYYTQTAYKVGGQTGSNLISVSNASGTNNITIAFTGWHSNSHGWNCKIISYQA